jgi:hypothetical protein
MLIIRFPALFISLGALFLVLANAKMDISCLAEDNKTFVDMNQCANRIYDGISSSISSSGYNTANIPVLSSADLPIQVNASITFNSVVSVDQINGIVTVAVFVDLYWRDAYLTWNGSLTSSEVLGIILINQNQIWTPDFILFNSQSSSAGSLNPAGAYIYPDGSIWWSRQGILAFNCNFNLDDFPYDLQYCGMIFGSFNYGTNQLVYNFTSFIYPPDTYNAVQPPTVINPAFTLSQYNINEISTSSYMQEAWGYSFTYLQWTITLQRYPQYYLVSAVYPSLYITISALLALWINDISVRISVAVTALLAVIAVGWTVQVSIPVTNNLTWLGGITGGCTVFVFLVCVQCCFVAYMSTKKGTPKSWATFLIVLSVPSKWYSLLRNFNRDENRGQSSNIDSSAVAVEMTQNITTKNEMHHVKAVDDADEQDVSKIPKPDQRPELRSESEYIADALGLKQQHTTTTNSDLKTNDEISWLRAMRAFDRICRVVLPVSFFFLFLSYMSSPPSRSFGY